MQSSAAHDSTDPYPAPRLALAVAAVTFGGELLVCLMALQGNLWALGLHTLILGAVGWMFYRHRNHATERNLLELVWVGTACAGPFGALLGLSAAIVHSARRYDIPADELLAELLPEEEETPGRLHDRIVLASVQTGSIEPFQNILRGGSLKQKQLMIARIARHFRPQFTPLLLQAARDTNPAVRVQAATALAKIERDFMMRYLDLEKQVKINPKNRSLQMQLAQLCDAYAHGGLVDDAQRSHIRARATEMYRCCLASASSVKQQHEINLRLGRLYLRDDDPFHAYPFLRQAIEGTERPEPDLLLWYIEALFRLQKTTELRECVHRHRAALATMDTKQAGMDIRYLLDAWEERPYAA